MTDDNGGTPPQGPQPPAYPGAPVPQPPAYPAASPAPLTPVPPAPANPYAAPVQPAPSYPNPAPQQPAAPAYPGAALAAPGYPGAAPAAPGYPGAAPAAPGYAAPAYPQPYGQPYATPLKSNGLAVTSLICGIAGVALFWLAYLVLPFLASIAAIVTGHMGLGKIKRDPSVGGKGLAITGLILGYVGVVINLIVGAIIIIGFAFVASYGNSGY